MKKLINKIENVVKEQVEGLNLAHPELKLSLDPRYIWRDDAQGKVALLSGGGNGHEPLHAGFIGKGMLTAACPGEIFSSPTPDQMYECGHKINNDNGILFIIKKF